MSQGTHRAKPTDPRAAQAGATRKALAPVRVTARAWLAERFGTTLRALVAAGNAGASARAVARRVGLSHTEVERLCDALSGRGLHLDVVVAAGPEVAVAYLRAVLAKIEQASGVQDLRDLVLDVQSAAGRLAERVRDAQADGRITRDELDDIEGAAHAAQAAAATVLAECARTRRAMR